MELSGGFIDAMFSGLAETMMVYMKATKKMAPITVPPASKPYGGDWP
jgi:hypothetical protein